MSNQPTIEQLAVERDHLAAMIVAQMAGRPATASGQARAWRWNQYDIGQYEALSDEIARRGEPVQQGRLAISAGGR